MMGPALFELYAAPKKSDLAAQVAKSLEIQAAQQHKPLTREQSLPALTRESSFKSATSSFFGTRKNSQTATTNSSTMGIGFKTPPRPFQSFRLMYFGHSVLDRRYTSPMLTWIVADMKRQSMDGETGKVRNIYLEVSETTLTGRTVSDNQVLFVHPLQSLNKLSQTGNDGTSFTYLTRDHPESPYTCHVFQAADETTMFLERPVIELFGMLEEAQTEFQLLNNMDKLTDDLNFIACYSQSKVVELFQSITESCKEIVPQKGGNCRQLVRMGSHADLDSVMNNSQQYEVMYVGRLRVPQKRGSESFIDEAVERFQESESFRKKELINENESSEFRDRTGSGSSTCSLTFDQPTTIPTSGLPRPRSISSLTVCDEKKEDEMESGGLFKVTEEQKEGESSVNNLKPPTLITNSQSLDENSKQSILKDLKHCSEPCQIRVPIHNVVSKQTSLPVTASMPRRRRYQNKPMLFLIGRLEVRLISPDHQQILLNKTFDHIYHCGQGMQYPDHFGFICRDRESNAVTAESYVGFIFRCQSANLVREILHSLQQAFQNAQATFQKRQKGNYANLCESCPMHWYHRLCCDLEGLDAEKTWVYLMKSVQSGLNEEEKDEVMTKYASAKTYSTQEQNDLFMTILRKLCEKNQRRHRHTGNENESDHPYLEKKSSSIDTFKAKVNNSFEQLLKTNSIKRDDGRCKGRSMSDAQYFPLSARAIKDLTSPTNKSLSVSPKTMNDSGVFGFDEDLKERNYNTVCLPVDPKKLSRSDSTHGSQMSIFTMFSKIGNNSSNKNGKELTENEAEKENRTRGGITSSLRRAIFNRVNSSTLKGKEPKDLISGGRECQSRPNRRRTPDELRRLWKTAIKQQILLIQMEKENRRLRDTQSLVSYKRMKLDYEDPDPCPDEAALAWDQCLKDRKRWTKPQVDELSARVKAGVPRLRRGEVWTLLMDRYRRSTKAKNWYDNEGDREKMMKWDEKSYRDLLNELTPNQHAILVDLGRTFPKHPYYSQPLGPGQLSLFNLLKAYSLLDNEVGYCQGLSFVAGILLLHVNEEVAFKMMKHLLFHNGLRKQYTPDMSALQLQLYQLTRLIHDFERDLFDHLEFHDVSATLYAAPWFLTLFASQFTIGFVSRLFDVIFLLGIEGVFRVSLSLLTVFKQEILKCNSFESIMDLLRTDLPNLSVESMNKVIHYVFQLDLGEKLMMYDIEYHVVQEETCTLNSTNEIPVYESKGSQCDPGPETVETEAQTSTTASHLEMDQEYRLTSLQNDLRDQKRENMQLSDQLHVAQSSVNSLESSLDRYKSTMKQFETRIRTVEEERDALLQSNTMIRRRCEKLEAELAALISAPSATSSTPPPPALNEPSAMVTEEGAGKRSPGLDTSVKCEMDVLRRSSNEDGSVFDF